MQNAKPSHDRGTPNLRAAYDETSEIVKRLVDLGFAAEAAVLADAIHVRLGDDAWNAIHAEEAA